MKKMKGFTLIECIVAIAVLGVSSVLLCQGFAQLMKVTNENNTMSMSIAEQMSDAESQRDGSATMLSTPVNSDTYNSSEGRTFKMEKEGSSTVYTTNVEVYCVNPYETKGTQNASSTKDGTDIRYIYFHR